MLTDRLAELKKKSNNSNQIDKDQDIEQCDSALDSQLRATQTKISVDIRKLKEHANSLRAMTINQQTKGTDEFIKEGNSMASLIRQRLQVFKAENDRLSPTLKTEENKIRENIYQTLLRSFIEALQFYSDSQKDHKAKFVERVTREARIVNPGITEREIHEMIETGQTENLFAVSAEETRHSDAINALKYITQQKEELKSLEESIHEIQQLFLELDTLVLSQDPRIDYVCEEITQAHILTAAGVENLDAAERECNKRRKRLAVAGAGAAAVGTAAVGGTAVAVGAKAAGVALCLVM